MTRTDVMQDVPPEGWRIIHIVPPHVNLRLEAEPHKVVVLCTQCFDVVRRLLP